MYNHYLIDGLKIGVLTLLNFGMYAFIVFAFVNRYISGSNLKKYASQLLLIRISKEEWACYSYGIFYWS